MLQDALDHCVVHGIGQKAAAAVARRQQSLEGVRIGAGDGRRSREGFLVQRDPLKALCGSGNLRPRAATIPEPRRNGNVRRVKASCSSSVSGCSGFRARAGRTGRRFPPLAIPTLPNEGNDRYLCFGLRIAKASVVHRRTRRSRGEPCSTIQKSSNRKSKSKSSGANYRTGSRRWSGPRRRCSCRSSARWRASAPSAPGSSSRSPISGPSSPNSAPR